MRIILSTLCFVIVMFSAFSTMSHNKVVVIPLFGSDDKTPTVISKTGRIWMDRNLGAIRLAENKNDELAYGSLYQWGRLADGHESRTSSVAALNDRSNDDVPGHDKFIPVDTPPLDWRSSPNDSLWKGVSGVNNPCPNGFRVPTAQEWEDEMNTWFSKDQDGAFGSRLRLTNGGLKDFVNGDLLAAGEMGLYWTSDDSGEFSIFVQLWPDTIYVGPTARASGFSVRCIRD